MRCKVCKIKFIQKYFLQKTCSKECEKIYREENPKKQLNKQSEKTKELNKQYLRERKEFLKGKVCPVTNKPATEIHHINGREYERLLNQDYWLGVTRYGHAWIHANPKQAREKGWLK
jgi:hypothetical protein